MTDASTLHCRNCGAAADPAAGRCPYCRARLATVACPSCLGLMFEGARFCPHCGAARTRSAAEDAGSTCPACRAALQQVEIGDVALLECSACDSVWLDADVFEQLCAEREAQSAVLHRYEGRPVAAAAADVRYRPCVRCGTMMNRVNFRRISGVVVDVCKGHGTFLDAGELHRILSFITNGGLERARQREMEDLRIQRKRLADLESKASRARGADRHRSTWDGSDLLPWLESSSDGTDGGDSGE